MPDLILLNKPYGVICQFSSHALHPTLKDYVGEPGFYPAGRLDTDSEGLLLLTNDGALQHRISDPRWKLPKTYWVQVEGIPSDAQLDALRGGVDLGDFITRPAHAERLDAPALWPRNPPIRQRKTVSDSWIALTISEGKNRQVRRMTARVGLPTLRLVRVAIGPWSLDGLEPGAIRKLNVGLEDLPRVKHSVGIDNRAGQGRRPAPHDKGGPRRRG
jgi:23S rRNA pseudouridine2457 synthase